MALAAFAAEAAHAETKSGPRTGYVDFDVPLVWQTKDTTDVAVCDPGDKNRNLYGGTGRPQVQGLGPGPFHRGALTNGRVELVNGEIQVYRITHGTTKVRVRYDSRPSSWTFVLEWQPWVPCYLDHWWQADEPYGKTRMTIRDKPDTTPTAGDPVPLKTVYRKKHGFNPLNLNEKVDEIVFTVPASWRNTKGRPQVAGCGRDFSWVGQGGGTTRGDRADIVCFRTSENYVHIRYEKLIHGTWRSLDLPEVARDADVLLERIRLWWSIRPSGDIPVTVEWQPVAGSDWRPSDGGPLGKRSFTIIDP